MGLAFGQTHRLSAHRKDPKEPPGVIMFKLGPPSRDPLDTPVVWLHVEWANVRDVVHKLFPSKHLRIDPDVTGTVSLRLHRGTVAQALYQALHQVGAAYDIRSQTLTVSRSDPAGMSMDELATLWQPNVPWDQRLVTVSGEGVDVRETLGKILQTAEVSYSIAPEIQGTVTFAYKNTPLIEVLEGILRQFDATFRIEAGVVLISMRDVP